MGTCISFLAREKKPQNFSKGVRKVKEWMKKHAESDQEGKLDGILLTEQINSIKNMEISELTELWNLSFEAQLAFVEMIRQAGSHEQKVKINNFFSFTISMISEIEKEMRERNLQIPKNKWKSLHK